MIKISESPRPPRGSGDPRRTRGGVQRRNCTKRGRRGSSTDDTTTDSAIEECDAGTSTSHTNTGDERTKKAKLAVETSANEIPIEETEIGNGIHDEETDVDDGLDCTMAKKTALLQRT